ncbi:esterase [Microbacterium sp. NEAU-LLC]|uniref:Esterase n=1 Tax=Microbacterium helvum TaxID=2773713 RepID=A0ABR8NTA6_9MICO|nr:alpha/beta hydrolase-fold protein [Microbacterium helvum]MBD3943854.1 esterase [Microbacterium helvum]
MRNDLRARKPRAAGATAAGLAVAVAISIVTAVPAVAAAPDPWESQQGIYHYFTVPKSQVPSNACGNSTGAGAEIEGNFGPSKSWAAMGLDGNGANCVANIGPLEPGLYYYQYVATMPDRSKVVFRSPDSPVAVTSHPDWNTLFVPGPEVTWMDDVATGGGTVSELTYDSPGTDGRRSAMVWTPPGYTAKQAHAYPVLYLLADEGQSAREWLELGRASQVLDNLAVDGDLAAMVVVMADAGDADFRAEVVDGIVPAVQSAYNVSDKVKETGIAGIGRGASQALELAAGEPGVFGAVGSLSGYLSEDTHVTPALARKLNAKTDLLRFYVGNTLDPHYNGTYEAMQELKGAGVRLEFDGVHPETGGVWDTWRENLRDFATRAFQPSVHDRGPSAGHLAQTEPYAAPAVGSIATPHIDADGMVTFETGTQWADAKDVVLWGDWAPNGQWFRIPLTKEGDRWRTTIGPIDGYYYWRYEVDGVGSHDPQDTTNVVNMESQLFVPGGERTPLLADVPADQAGDVSTLSYTGAFGASKVKVWTPVDYDPNRAEAYPVLYLYHGYGQNYASWTEVGRASQILDNLYARGDIRPMVVVMPGYTGAPFDIWGDLAGNVMPLVSAQYNVSDDASERALAGLSWGGFLTNGAMLNHPGNFAYFGMFSPPFTAASLDPSTPGGQTVIATTKSVTLYAGDVDAGAVSAINGVEAGLTANGIPTFKTIIPGPHGFDVWWQGLSDFLPRLF